MKEISEKFKKKKRTMEDIQQDYANKCAQLGEIYYKRTEELVDAENRIITDIRELNKEGLKLRNQESQSKTKTHTPLPTESTQSTEATQ